MKNPLISLLLFLFVISLSSCLKNNTEYLPLGNVKLQMTEDLSINPRRLHFNFFTEEEYECLNYIIRHTSTTTAGNIDINLIDIEKSALCLSAIGPALVIIELDSYQPGSYQVLIKVGSVTNTGSLEVTDERYIITFEDTEMVTVQYDTLNRIPDNLIWGIVGYHFEEGEAIVDSFLDSLENIGAQPRALIPGEYGYFQADSAGQIIAPEGLEFNFNKTFVYDYYEPMELVQEVIDYFSNVYTNDLYIYLYNSEGEIFTSDN